MQKSKSSVSFGPTTEHIDLTGQVRSQRRSSLDRFVIHGRTRFPSSETSKSSISLQDATNMRIAQTLLNYRDMPQSMPASFRPGPRASTREDYELAPKRSQSSENEQRTTDIETTPRPVTRRGEQLRLLRPGLRYANDIDPQNVAEAQDLLTAPHPSMADMPADLNQYQTDGVGGLTTLRPFQSMMSMGSANNSWVNVSRRMASNSSSGSQASRACRNTQIYNNIAKTLGLILIEGDLSDHGTSSDRKQVSQRLPKVGWFKRKILRRSSSAVDLKPKDAPTRKRSFGALRSRSIDALANVLMGKTLDEVVRLGGLAALDLPSDFAVGKLEVPSSLSATGAYILEHAFDGPGIFRIPGTKKTIDTLYHYFDHQFSEAGSPSKVHGTVAVGVLPSEIEYTLADIASLFKRIIDGFPGSLLGSLQLFEVLRKILLDWQPDPSEHKEYLIALVINCVPNVYRFQLIQAVLGLVAYLGYEGDKAQSVGRNEIMDSRNLSKVLGPLLLGPLVDSVDIGIEGSRGVRGTPVSATLGDEQPEKVNDAKRSIAAKKLETGAGFSDQVERLNLSADFMQSLLIIWPAVIKQLRELSGESQYTLQVPTNQGHVNKQPRRATSGLTLRNSDEEGQFQDALRGRKLPRDIKAPLEGIISNRSPVGQRKLEASKDSHRSRLWLSDASLGTDRENSAGSHTVSRTTPQGSASVVGATSRNPGDSLGLFTEDVPQLNVPKRTNSDFAMEKMSEGTILERRNESSTSLEPITPSRDLTPSRTPRNRSDTSSSSRLPETAIRRVLTPAQEQGPIRLIDLSTKDKPLPPIRAVQKHEGSHSAASTDVDDESHGRIISKSNAQRSRSSTERSPLVSRRPTQRTLFSSGEQQSSGPPLFGKNDDDAEFPPRQSSLSPGDTKSNNQLRHFNTVQDYEEYRSNDPSSLPLPPALRKISKPLDESGQMTAQHKKHDNLDKALPFLGPYEAPRALRNEDQAQPVSRSKDASSAKAPVHPNLLEHSVANPFTASAQSSYLRNTMIPQPVVGVGPSRKTPSPLKRRVPTMPRDHPQPRSTVRNAVHDRDAEIIMANGKARLDISRNELGATTQQMPPETVRREEGSTTHQRSQVLDEFLDRTESTAGKSDVMLESRCRDLSANTFIIPSERDASNVTQQDPKAKPSSHADNSDSDTNKPGNLKRHSSTNTAMYQKIITLQKQVEQLQVELAAQQRNFDAAAEVRSADTRGFDQSNPPSRGSWTNHMYNDEYREAVRENKELKRQNKEVKEQNSYWKQKAQELAQRSADNDSAGEVMGGYHVDAAYLSSSDKNSKERPGFAAKENNVNVKVLLNMDGEKPDNASRLHKAKDGRSHEVEDDVPDEFF